MDPPFLGITEAAYTFSICTELQKRGGIEDISKILFLISQRKHML